MAEVEHLVNSRPLTHISRDPTDEEVLTPNHFLIGTASGTFLPGLSSTRDLCSRKQWQVAQAHCQRILETVDEILPADFVSAREMDTARESNSGDRRPGGDC